MRTLTDEFKEAIEFGPIHPALLVYLDFEGDPLRAWSGVGDLVHGGYTWLGVGSAAEIGELQESSDVRATQAFLRLYSVPNTALADLENTEWKGRDATIDLVLFAEDGQTIIGEERFFTGTIDLLTVKVSPGQSIIEVTLSNALETLRQSWGYRYTGEDQKTLYPGDTSLRFSGIIQNKQLDLGA